MKTLRVGAAFPDPPFNGVGDGGLDIDLINAVAGVMGVSVQFVAYDGSDFDGIFDELGSGRYDCVVSGTTVTPDRERMAAFAPPYLVSGQSLAVDTERFPHGQVRRRPGRADDRCPAGQHQPADRRAPRRARQGQGGPGLPLRRHPDRADRPDHRRLRRVHEAGAGAHRTRRARRRGRGGATEPLAGGHRDRGRRWRGRAAAADGRPRKPNSRTTAHCRASGASGSAIPTSTRAWPPTDQPSHGDPRTTRLVPGNSQKIPRSKENRQ